MLKRSYFNSGLSFKPSFAIQMNREFYFPRAAEYYSSCLKREPSLGSQSEISELNGANKFFGTAFRFKNGALFPDYFSSLSRWAGKVGTKSQHPKDFR